MSKSPDTLSCPVCHLDGFDIQCLPKACERCGWRVELLIGQTSEAYRAKLSAARETWARRGAISEEPPDLARDPFEFAEEWRQRLCEAKWLAGRVKLKREDYDIEAQRYRLRPKWSDWTGQLAPPPAAGLILKAERDLARELFQSQPTDWCAVIVSLDCSNSNDPVGISAYNLLADSNSGKLLDLAVDVEMEQEKQRVAERQRKAEEDEKQRVAQAERERREETESKRREKEELNRDVLSSVSVRANDDLPPLPDELPPLPEWDDDESMITDRGHSILEGNFGSIRRGEGLIEHIIHQMDSYGWDEDRYAERIDTFARDALSCAEDYWGKRRIHLYGRAASHMQNVGRFFLGQRDYENSLIAYRQIREWEDEREAAQQKGDNPEVNRQEIEDIIAALEVNVE